MASLVEVLYPLPDYRRRPLTLLRWWESRRLFYNVVVGATGLVTVCGMVVLTALPPRSELILHWFLLVPIGVYGVLANACYSLGWLTEMLARWVWGSEAPELGPLLFRQGLIFSVGLTLLPLGVATLFWLIRIVTWLVPAWV